MALRDVVRIHMSVDGEHAELLQKFNREFRAAITLHLSFLAAETADLAHGHADDPSIDQSKFDVFKLERTDDRFDFFHGCYPALEKLRAQACCVGEREGSGFRRSPAREASDMSVSASVRLTIT